MYIFRDIGFKTLISKPSNFVEIKIFGFSGKIFSNQHQVP